MSDVNGYFVKTNLRLLIYYNLLKDEILLKHKYSDIINIINT